MDNKIVKARLGKVPIKLPPVSNKGKKTLAAKQNEQQHQPNDQQPQPSEQQQSQNKQRQHQITYDSDLSEDGRAEQQSLMSLKKVQSERLYKE